MTIDDYPAGATAKPAADPYKAPLDQLALVGMLDALRHVEDPADRLRVINALLVFHKHPWATGVEPPRFAW